MDIRKIAKAVMARDPNDYQEDRGFSVGFSISIDPEDWDELVADLGDEAAGNEYSAMLFAAAKDASAIFDNPVEVLEQETDYSASADFKHWVTDLQKFADIIAESDMSISDGRIDLSNGLVAENFHAVRGHWGRGDSVPYDRWDEAFGIEL